ncbi:MAG: SPFH domain-containing protein [Candidatus Riflebacteria bacterium]|nr:SPFH domain-containing protein [Candidatus Riflebacteria bacterium]
MGFFSNQLRSVIEWKDPSPDVLIWKWDGTNDELKNCSKLLINPGQAAIFIYEGQVQAIHNQPGLFELRTANLPFWTTISKFLQNFESEHKAKVYFIKLTEFVNQKWGTKGPIKYDDPKYKFPVGLRAFGNFSFKIVQPTAFFTDFAGTRDYYSIEEIRPAIVERILTPLTDLFAESGFSYSEIDKNRVELSNKLKKDLAEEFTKFGFELTDFRIENTAFDEDTKRRIDKIADNIAEAHAVNALGNVGGAGMQNYATIQQLKAMNSAASNPNGTAGAGMGMGAGIAMGQVMAGAFQNPQASAHPHAAQQSAMVKCQSCNANMEAAAKFCPECGKPNTAGKVACTSCGKPVEQGAKFCPECGAQQTRVSSCPSCKAELAPGAKFCPNCGGKIN